MREMINAFRVHAVLLAVSGSAHATFHLWHITQLYSDADGTIQFVELKAYAGGQQYVGGHTMTSSQGSTTNTFTFPADLPGNTATTTGGGYYGGGSTTYKSMLIGTQGFAALGVVTPDYVVPNGFLFTTNGRVNYAEGASGVVVMAMVVVMLGKGFASNVHVVPTIEGIRAGPANAQRARPHVLNDRR